MKKILNIISSPMGQYSNSIKLQNGVVDRLLSEYPGSLVTTKDITEYKYPHIDASNIAAFFGQLSADSAEYAQAIQKSDEAIDELMNADIIVIGTPMYNFGIPSALKAWIDHIIRIGKTFAYNEAGLPVPLVHNKKMYLAISSGSVYTEGPYKPYDFIEPYIRAVFGFIGITDITTFRAEGTAIPGVQETALQKGLESVAV
jgi:FMN-dependent NADH-azoreductase